MEKSILKRIADRLNLLFSETVKTVDENGNEVDVVTSNGEIQTADTVTSGQVGEVTLPEEQKTITVDENGNVIDVAKTEEMAEIPAEEAASEGETTETETTETEDEAVEDERLKMLEAKVDELLSMFKEMIGVVSSQQEELACVKEQPIKEKFSQIPVSKKELEMDRLMKIKEYLKNK